jgi:hypothetical protein
LTDVERENYVLIMFLFLIDARHLKKGRVTVPQPERDVPIGTLKSIEKQSGLKLR